MTGSILVPSQSAFTLAAGVTANLASASLTSASLAQVSVTGAPILSQSNGASATFPAITAYVYLGGGATGTQVSSSFGVGGKSLYFVNGLLVSSSA